MFKTSLLGGGKPGETGWSLSGYTEYALAVEYCEMNSAVKKRNETRFCR